MNQEASKFYLLAGAEMQNTKHVDMGAVQSFRELANVHTRKMKFLQVRLTDPTSLYDIGEIRDRLKPKWKKFEDEEKVQKGRKKPGDFQYKADKTKNEPEVELEVGDSELKVYQFTLQKDLHQAQKEIKSAFQELQQNLELLTVSFSREAAAVGKWMADSQDDPNNRLKQSTHVNNPFAKNDNLAKIKKQELTTLHSSLDRILKQDIQSLKQQVNEKQTSCNLIFRKL